MPPIRIIPEYALVLRYDVRAKMNEQYFRYVISEFVPALQERGIYMQDAWHIAYGAYPERQVEFITERIETLRELFDDPQWDDMEATLKRYVENYSLRICRYQGVFKV